ncbi:MAG: hypothetical protein HKN43_03815 [Rhodothermales bacterium]|nr:hypothetical protein [Rhodothermales bacterium]
MDSILVLIVLQIPTVAILFFSVYLFREVQRDRAALLSARETLENASLNPAEVGVSNDAIEKISSELDAVQRRISMIESNSSADLSDADRDQIANQKRALKEFGRVLSKTSEQTYTEMQDLDQRISALHRAMEINGFEIQRDAA